MGFIKQSQSTAFFISIINMKKLIIPTFVFVLSHTAMGSSSYIDQGTLRRALENNFGIGSGFGAKNNSCLLCHNTSAGGLGNINTSFGIDFEDAAIAVEGRGNGLSLSQLENVLNDATLRSADSDGDDESNEDEFIADTDPADDIGGGGVGTPGDTGGCGMIAPPKSGGTGFPPAVFLIFLPLLVLLGLRKKQI